MTVADRAWQPCATPDTLRLRAAMLGRTRRFFAARNVLEVQTPVAGRHAITTPEIASMALAVPRGRFLRTSPELAHKRLLAAGVGDVYELGPVFRDGECGRRHNPEFTLLEWYRVGYDEQALMAEVAELLHLLLPALGPESVTLSYADAFAAHLDLDVFDASDAQLARCARALDVAPAGELERDQWLELLFATVVAPALSRDVLTFVTGYPASQAALARIDDADPRVARRFEAFAGGMELANGFYELTDAALQRERFVADNRRRQRNGLPQHDIDEDFLAALAAGMPDCAGVAVGFDRLVMLAGGLDAISDALAFDWPRA